MRKKIESAKKVVHHVGHHAHTIEHLIHFGHLLHEFTHQLHGMLAHFPLHLFQSDDPTYQSHPPTPDERHAGVLRSERPLRKRR